MMVKNYFNEELTDIMFEADALEEWKVLASEMGMEKQLDFVKKAETPIPYPNINSSMNIVFKTLCPSVVDFKAYNKTPIPLEIMKQLSMSIKDKHFKRIEIWWDDKKLDPIAVGITEQYYAYNNNYNHLQDANKCDIYFDSPEEAKSYCALVDFPFYNSSYTNREYYLIARWADELRPVEELRMLASERLMEKYGAELKIEIENATQAIKKLKENIVSYLNGEISEDAVKGKSKW